MLYARKIIKHMMSVPTGKYSSRVTLLRKLDRASLPSYTVTRELDISVCTGSECNILIYQYIIGPLERQLNFSLTYL
jgi:hypothetical protein